VAPVALTLAPYGPLKGYSGGVKAQKNYFFASQANSLEPLTDKAFTPAESVFRAFVAIAWARLTA
jgi:hypothetical protein